MRFVVVAVGGGVGHFAMVCHWSPQSVKSLFVRADTAIPPAAYRHAANMPRPYRLIGEANYSESGLTQHEIKTASEPALVLGGADQQFPAEQAVGTVLGLAREIELGGQHASAARLHLHMEVAGAGGVGAGHDAAQPEASVSVGELMAAQAEAGIVVLALVVGLPEIQQRTRDRLAIACEHEAGQFDRLAGHAGFQQFDPLRRGRLEERPLGLRQSYFVAVVACGRRRKRPLRDTAANS